MKKVSLGCMAAAGLLATAGCLTSVKSEWDKSPTGEVRARVSVLSSGTQSEALAKGFDAGPEGSILEDASGKQDSTSAVEAFRDIAVAYAPLLNALASGKVAAPTAASTGVVPDAPAAAQAGTATPDPADTGGQTLYVLDNFDGVAADNGTGVYGDPSCSRCRAYLANHPGAKIINIRVQENQARMRQALKDRGFAGGAVKLPVEITSGGFTAPAK